MFNKKSPKNKQEDSLDISMVDDQKDMGFNLDSFLAETPKKELDLNEHETNFESGYFDDNNLISVVDNLTFDEITLFDDKHLQDDDEIIDIDDLTSEPMFSDPTFIEPMFSEFSSELEQEPLISSKDDLATSFLENNYPEFGFGELNLDNEIDSTKVKEDLNLLLKKQKPVDALNDSSVKLRDFISDLSLADNNIFLTGFLTGLQPALLNMVQKSVEETIEKVLEKKLDLIVKQCFEKIVTKIKNDC